MCSGEYTANGDINMTTTKTLKGTINGNLTVFPLGAIAYKYQDPTESARWLYSADDLEDIISVDPSLIVLPEVYE